MSEKTKHLEENEVRVIKLSRAAIEEILWETFMEIGDDRLELEADSDDIIFRMTTDETMSELVFYACDFSGEKTPDFSRIDKFIKQNVQITTDSVFTVPGTGKYYQTIHIENADQIL